MASTSSSVMSSSSRPTSSGAASTRPTTTSRPAPTSLPAAPPSSPTVIETTIDQPPQPSQPPAATTPVPAPTPETQSPPPPPPPPLPGSTIFTTLETTDGAGRTSTVLVTRTRTPTIPVSTPGASSTTGAVIGGGNGGNGGDAGGGNGGGSSSSGGGGGGGKSGMGGTIALAVVLPIVAVAAAVAVGLWLLRRRRARLARQEMQKEALSEYAYNPNDSVGGGSVRAAEKSRDSRGTLSGGVGVGGSGSGGDMGDAEAGGYRGWGTGVVGTAGRRHASNGGLGGVGTGIATDTQSSVSDHGGPAVMDGLGIAAAAAPAGIAAGATAPYVVGHYEKGEDDLQRDPSKASSHNTYGARPSLDDDNAAGTKGIGVAYGSGVGDHFPQDSYDDPYHHGGPHRQLAVVNHDMRDDDGEDDVVPDFNNDSYNRSNDHNNNYAHPSYSHRDYDYDYHSSNRLGNNGPVNTTVGLDADYPNATVSSPPLRSTSNPYGDNPYAFAPAPPPGHHAAVPPLAPSTREVDPVVAAAAAGGAVGGVEAAAPRENSSLRRMAAGPRTQQPTGIWSNF